MLKFYIITFVVSRSVELVICLDRYVIKTEGMLYALYRVLNFNS